MCICMESYYSGLEYIFNSVGTCHKQTITFHHLQEVINHLRQHSHCTTYGSGMSAPVVMQILTAFKILMGEDDTNEGTGKSHVDISLHVS